MMKDIVIKCCLFAFLVLIPFSNVHADDEADDGGLGSYISYFLNNVSLYDDKIVFEGTAFRDQANNNHKYRNISQIRMYAVNVDNSNAEKIYGTTEILDKKNYNGENNYYNLNCLWRGSGLNTGHPKHCNPEMNSTCANGDCMLRNLDFRSTFKYSDLKAKANNVYFVIEIATNPNNTSLTNRDVYNSNGTLSNVESVTPSVYFKNCHILANGQNKTCSSSGDTDVVTGDSKLVLSGPSDHGYVTTTQSKPQTNVNGSYSCSGNCSCYFITGQRIKINDTPIGGLFYSMNNTFFKVKTDYNVLVNNNLGTSYGFLVNDNAEINRSTGYLPTVNHSVSSCQNAINAGSKYISWSWMQMEGMITLSFTENQPKPEPVISKVENCGDSSITYNAKESKTINVSATYGSGMCKRTVKSRMTAYYRMYETGDIRYNFERGPIYNGGHFGLQVNYTNTAVWTYDPSTQACPRIYIPHPNVCCGLTGCHCCGSATRPADRKYIGGSSYGISCPMGDLRAAKVHYEQEIAKRYSTSTIKDRSSNGGKVVLPDSNTVGAASNSTAGKWECSEVFVGYNQLTGTRYSNWNSTWKDNQARTVRCTYTLKDSYINKQTSFVSYFDKSSPPSEIDKYIMKSGVYYIPLRWKEQYFPFNVSFSSLGSLIGNLNWSLSDTCKVETMQRFYDEERTNRSKYVKENGIPSSEVSFMYYYRPIQLTTPFPGRDASSNWITWIKDNKNKERLLKTYTNGKMEYKFSLDSDTISDIIEYNRTKLSNGSGKGYLDYDELSMDGKSSFIGGIIKNQSTDRIEHYRLGMVSE